jgi:hypothetical protein
MPRTEREIGSPGKADHLTAALAAAGATMAEVVKLTVFLLIRLIRPGGHPADVGWTGTRR